MMKLRNFQRWILLGIPLALTFTVILYFQINTPSPQPQGNSQLGDANDIIARERTQWQERIKTLHEELGRMQLQQSALQAGLKDQEMAVAEQKARKQLEEHNDQPVVPRTERPNVHVPRRVDPVVVAEPVKKAEDQPIAVLVMGCNRPDALKRSITQLLKVRPSAEKFPLIVSLDCGFSMAEDALREFGHDVKLIKQPDLSPVDMGEMPPAKRRMMEGYYKISRHYKFALTEVFEKMGYESVIIVEDDLDVAVDFFDYMAAGERLMSKDKTIWCVSAWNDNGKEAFIDTGKPELLYRSDFFPGLGWMLKRDLWAELSVKWPKSFWDDWMRNPAQRKGRACIRPEVSRTFTFGLVGVSQGQFWKQHLQYIHLNKEKVHFAGASLDYLLKDEYDKVFKEKVYSSPEASFGDIPVDGASSVRVMYRNNVDFKMKAKQFQVMDDLRAGVPRMAYMGVVSFMQRGQRVYLAPSQPWAGYQDS